MVVLDRATGVSKLVAPGAIPEIHATKDAGVREIGEDPPDRRPVVDPLAEGLHDLFMSERSCSLMEHHEHIDARSGRPQILPAHEGADFITDLLQVSSQGVLLVD